MAHGPPAHLEYVQPQPQGQLIHWPKSSLPSPLEGGQPPETSDPAPDPVPEPAPANTLAPDTESEPAEEPPTPEACGEPSLPGQPA